MTSLFKKILAWIGFLILLLCTFLFYKIAIYFTLSVFVYLMCQPIKQILQNTLFKKIKASEVTFNFLAFIILISFLILIGIFIFPTLFIQTKLIITNRTHLVPFVLDSFPALSRITQEYMSKTELLTLLNTQIAQVFDQIQISVLIGNSLELISNVFSGIFCVMVISIFLLKDRTLIVKIIDAFTPDKYHHEILQSVRKSRIILGKYYLALLLDMFVVAALSFILLSCFGYKNAFIIAIFAGLFNAIPYVGPLLTFTLSLILTLNEAFISHNPEHVSSQLIIAILCLCAVYLFDAAYLQPKLFSKSIQAHPLEVFTIIIMAGSIGGVIGMMFAVPLYSLIRVISSTFLSHIEFFNTISKNIK